MGQRVDSVESKLADLAVDCRALREAIPPSAEHMAADLTKLQVTMSKFKADHA